MVINTPAACSMDWAAGFEEIVFLGFLGVSIARLDFPGGFFYFLKNSLQIICTVQKEYLPLT